MQDREIKTLTGIVLSNSGEKTVKVVINYKVKHPKYGKYVRRRTRLAVHDEHNQSKVGDVIEISECRPRSKNKNFRLVRVVQKAAQV